MRVPSGTTDQYFYFVALDATDRATRETGLSSFTVYRSRDGGTAAAMTTPTINETDSSNMPGVYELLLDEDMTIGSDNDSEEMIFHITHAGMAPVTRTIELYRPKITVGETITASSGVASANAVQISGDGTAADNLETACDGGSFNLGGGGVVSASVTGSVGGNVTGSVGSLATQAKADVNAECDTAISDAALATASALSTVDGNVDAIKTIADALPDSGALTSIATAASISALNNISTAQVNAEVVDALATDTYAEPGQGAPAATASLAAKINYLFKAWRNKREQTATEQRLYNDAGDTVDQKSTCSDDGTTFTRGEVGTGA